MGSLIIPGNIPAEVALDPHRNALMDNIRGSGGKRGLKSVPKREKKHTDFMDVLRREQGMQGVVKKPARPKAKPETKKTPTGLAAIAKLKQPFQNHYLKNQRTSSNPPFASQN